MPISCTCRRVLKQRTIRLTPKELGIFQNSGRSALLGAYVVLKSQAVNGRWMANIRSLATRLHRDRRTVHRLLEEMRAIGAIELVSDSRPRQYQLVAAEQDPPTGVQDLSSSKRVPKADCDGPSAPEEKHHEK